MSCIIIPDEGQIVAKLVILFDFAANFLLQKLERVESIIFQLHYLVVSGATKTFQTFSNVFKVIIDDRQVDIIFLPGLCSS